MLLNAIKGRKEFCGYSRIIFLIIFKTISAFKEGQLGTKPLKRKNETHFNKVIKELI